MDCPENTYLVHRKHSKTTKSIALVLFCIKAVKVRKHLYKMIKLLIIPTWDSIIEYCFFLLKGIIRHLLTKLSKRKQNGPAIIRRRFPFYISGKFKLFNQSADRTAVHGCWLGQIGSTCGAIREKPTNNMEGSRLDGRIKPCRSFYV